MIDPHSGERPCFMCKYHEYSWLELRYDKCKKPGPSKHFCNIMRIDTSANDLCGEKGRWFETKKKTNKKWWQFWKEKYE